MNIGNGYAKIFRIGIRSRKNNARSTLYREHITVR